MVCLLCSCVWFLCFGCFVVIDSCLFSFCLCGMSVCISSGWVLLVCFCSVLIPLHVSLFACVLSLCCDVC